MPDQEVFDVFLAHKSEDKPQVRIIYKRLIEMGLKPWLDEEEILPGVQEVPEELSFLGQLQYVSFTNGIDDSEIKKLSRGLIKKKISLHLNKRDKDGILVPVKARPDLQYICIT